MRDDNCAVGLIESLVVIDQGECYEILDGHLRYRDPARNGRGNRVLLC